MKKSFIISLVVLSLWVLGACTRPASPSVVDGLPYPGSGPAPSVQDGLPYPESPMGMDGLPYPPAVTQPSPGEVIVTQPSEPVVEAPTTTEVQPEAAPTATPMPADPTATPLAPVDTNQPTPTATVGPSPTAVFAGETFDPRATWGKPTFVDTMDRSSITNWARPEDGILPNTSSFKIEILDNRFFATGKVNGYSTWWFSWPSLKDFYIEFEANSQTCAGKDAYGLILRGPEHLAGESYGYIVALSCDGSFWVFRLDGVEPWNATLLQDWTATSQVKTGSDQTNVLGVRMEGKLITVYINGKSVAEFKDATYSQGRYGLFVRPDSSLKYTFEGLNIAYWDLEKLP